MADRSKVNVHHPVDGVGFAFGKDTPSEDAAEVFEHDLRQRVSEHNGKVHVWAYASASGDEDFNQALSERRADWTVAKLIEWGVARDQIEVHAMGEKASPITVMSAPSVDEVDHDFQRTVHVKLEPHEIEVAKTDLQKSAEAHEGSFANTKDAGVSSTTVTVAGTADAAQVDGGIIHDAGVYISAPAGHEPPMWFSDAEALAGDAVASAILNLVPFVGAAKGLVEAITGEDFITGEEKAGWERVLDATVALTGGFGTGVKFAKNAANAGSDGAIVLKAGQDVVDALNALPHIEEMGLKGYVAQTKFQDFVDRAKFQDFVDRVGKLEKALNHADKVADGKDAWDKIGTYAALKVATAQDDQGDMSKPTDERNENVSYPVEDNDGGVSYPTDDGGGGVSYPAENDSGGVSYPAADDDGGGAGSSDETYAGNVGLCLPEDALGSMRSDVINHCGPSNHADGHDPNVPQVDPHSSDQSHHDTRQDLDSGLCLASDGLGAGGVSQGWHGAAGSANVLHGQDSSTAPHLTSGAQLAPGHTLHSATLHSHVDDGGAAHHEASGHIGDGATHGGGTQ